MTPKIFLSVGRTFTTEQEEFVRLVEDYLTRNGLLPQCVGRSVIKNQQPLKSIDECMEDCSGALILAFERTYIQNGIEKRGSPESLALENVNLPTVWNQIEAAMAYTLSKPLLVLVERGIKSDGLLEKGYDWYVKEIRLEKSVLLDSEFVGIFADWKRSVESFLNAPKSQQERQLAVDASALTVGQIIKSLRPAQLWAVLIAIVTALSTVAITAYKIGSTVAK